MPRRRRQAPSPKSPGLPDEALRHRAPPPPEPPNKKGPGLTTGACFEQIRKRDPEETVRVITDEDFPFYYRVRLNEFVAGEIGDAELKVKQDEWFAGGIIMTNEGRMTPWFYNCYSAPGLRIR